MILHTRVVLSIGAACLVLAACSAPTVSGLWNSAPESTIARPEADAGYKVLHSFAGGKEGAEPISGLLAVNGMLYGATEIGGTAARSTCYYGCGTVFEASTSGTLKTLHSFTSYPSDGAYPESGLINLKGTLYGTTTSGGVSPYYRGSVYAVTTAGKERTIYTFGKSGDGQRPLANVTALNGSLFGTTEYGGATYGCYQSEACGTVYGVSTAGKERILHNFGKPGSGDGFWPYAGLVAYNGSLWGTTPYGGTNGVGTLFNVSTAGKEQVVYSFTYGHYGAYPETDLTPYGGKLYGSTSAGGAYGHGAVFAVTTAGKESVVYAFKGSPTDGSWPQGLTVVNGKLYGVTRVGGTHKCFSAGEGCGTVFELTTSGTETILHNFAGGKDGAAPTGALVEVNGALYGTTFSGGSGNCSATSGNSGGCGTIFSVTPSL